MKKKILIFMILGLILGGCQNKKIYKYAVYNSDADYSFKFQGFELHPEFYSEFALPLTEQQINILKEKSVRIEPFFMISSFANNLSANPVTVLFDGAVNPQYTTDSLSGRLIPYYDESDLKESIQKRYVGKIDENKEYVYVSQFFANLIISNLYQSNLKSNTLPTTLVDLLDDEFTEEICIKTTFYVPISSYYSEKKENINDVDYGPFETYEYEYERVDKEYYIKGIISATSKYFDNTGSVIFVSEESYQSVASQALENVESSTKIVFSSTKSITKTFDELGLQYQILN